jgi:hypothetical protein
MVRGKKKGHSSVNYDDQKRFILDDELLSWQNEEKKKEMLEAGWKREERSLLTRKCILWTLVVLVMGFILWGWWRSFQMEVAEAPPKVTLPSEWERGKQDLRGMVENFKEVFSQIKENTSQDKLDANEAELLKNAFNESLKAEMKRDEWKKFMIDEIPMSVEYPKEWAVNRHDSRIEFVVPIAPMENEGEKSDDKFLENASAESINGVAHIAWEFVDEATTVPSWLEEKGRIAPGQALPIKNYQNWEAVVLVPSGGESSCGDELFTKYEGFIVETAFCIVGINREQRKPYEIYYEEMLNSIRFGKDVETDESTETVKDETKRIDSEIKSE